MHPVTQLSSPINVRLAMTTFDRRFQLYVNVLHTEQGNQRWQIPRPPHASAWQRSPY